MQASRKENIHPNLVIIGGGATGVGIAREAAERGFKVTLIERSKLGDGTSGHFHGMLHSGARYVVNDATVARDCYRENKKLRHIIPSAVRDTGGLFVATNESEQQYAQQLVHACLKAGIPIKEISRDQALTKEPHISHAIKQAFLVDDGVVDGTELLKLVKTAAQSAVIPATFIEYHNVTEVTQRNGIISSVNIKDQRTGVTTRIDCDYLINATGVWASKIAKQAGCSVTMTYDKGTMMILSHQFVQSVVNRCRPESDGDLLVPSAHGSIMGTTSRIIHNPDNAFPSQEEVDVLLREGKALVPQLSHAEVRQIYSGVRPLMTSKNEDIVTDTRQISRAFQIIDHETEGVSNFFSVIGGKVTLYRLMAEKTVDALESKQTLHLLKRTIPVTYSE